MDVVILVRLHFNVVKYNANERIDIWGWIFEEKGGWVKLIFKIYYRLPNLEY